MHKEGERKERKKKGEREEEGRRGRVGGRKGGNEEEGVGKEERLGKLGGEIVNRKRGSSNYSIVLIGCNFKIFLNPCYFRLNCPVNVFI